MGNAKSTVQTLLQDLALIRVVLSGMDWIKYFNTERKKDDYKRHSF